MVVPELTISLAIYAVGALVLTGLYPHAHREVQNDVDAPYVHELYLDTLAAADYRCEGFSYPGYGNPYTKPAYKAYLREIDLGPAEHLIERRFSAICE